VEADFARLCNQAPARPDRALDHPSARSNSTACDGAALRPGASGACSRALRCDRKLEEDPHPPCGRRAER